MFSELGQNFLQQIGSRGMNLDTYLQMTGLTSEQFIADLHSAGRRRRPRVLALDALARCELKVEVTDETSTPSASSPHVRAGVEDAAATKAQFLADGRMPAVRDSIRRSKAVDWLVDNAQVTEVDGPFARG